MHDPVSLYSRTLPLRYQRAEQPRKGSHDGYCRNVDCHETRNTTEWADRATELSCLSWNKHMLGRSRHLQGRVFVSRSHEELLLRDSRRPSTAV